MPQMPLQEIVQEQFSSSAQNNSLPAKSDKFPRRNDSPSLPFCPGFRRKSSAAWSSLKTLCNEEAPKYTTAREGKQLEKDKN